jgi:hypothetical protein
MRRLVVPVLLTAFSLLSLGTPALAGQSPSQPKPAVDPNERICEDIVQTGSRLASRRFCGTRAEWADRKKQDREAVEKAQLSPCVLTHNGGGGRASC